jgi:phosphoenolpyruvate carboxylase
VELLRRHRRPAGPGRGSLSELLLLSLNGVAAAMQSTG